MSKDSKNKEKTRMVGASGDAPLKKRTRTMDLEKENTNEKQPDEN